MYCCLFFGVHNMTKKLKYFVQSHYLTSLPYSKLPIFFTAIDIYTFFREQNNQHRHSDSRRSDGHDRQFSHQNVKNNEDLMAINYQTPSKSKDIVNKDNCRYLVYLFLFF